MGEWIIAVVALAIVLLFICNWIDNVLDEIELDANAIEERQRRKEWDKDAE